MVILSKNNPLVKELASLKEKKFRKKSGRFLVEGEKMVRECVNSGLNVVRLIVREGYSGNTYSLPVTELGESAFSAVCEEKTPQGIAAEVCIPRYPLEAPKKSCLLLDGLQDPANLGAIIRTANAVGLTELYLADCTDPYSPKCVRASMSGIFFVKPMQGTRQEILTALQGVKKIAADMAGQNVFCYEPPERYALCIGSEGSGLSPEIRREADDTLKIPMQERTESLNAAVSAGILMYLLNRKQFE